MHVSFLFSAVPVLAVADNTATPAVVLTANVPGGAAARLRSTQPSRGGMIWLLYLVDAGLLVTSSGLAWTVLIVEGAGVVMLPLTAALLWGRR